MSEETYKCFGCNCELDTNKDIYPMDYDGNAWCAVCWKKRQSEQTVI